MRPVNREILIFANAHLLTDFLLKKWNEIGREAIAEHGRFSVALSGGRTPLAFYARLSGFKDFDLWPKTHVFLVDERFVSFDHPESNFGMLRKSLLDHVNISPSNIHPIAIGQDNVALAAEDFKNDLVRFFAIPKEGLPRLDLILLGIGEDGHVASVLPGQEGGCDPKRLVVPVSSPRLKHERISLTLTVLNHARHVIFIVLGSRKAEIVRQVLEDGSALPAAMVKPTHGHLTYLLDKDAAQKLSSNA